jgi:hypothetical protein
MTSLEVRTYQNSFPREVAQRNPELLQVDPKLLDPYALYALKIEFGMRNLLRRSEEGPQIRRVDLDKRIPILLDCLVRLFNWHGDENIMVLLPWKVPVERGDEEYATVTIERLDR